MAETRVKININTGEYEVSGSQEFVEKHLEKLPKIIAALATKNVPKKSSGKPAAKPKAARLAKTVAPRAAKATTPKTKTKSKPKVAAKLKKAAIAKPKAASKLKKTAVGKPRATASRKKTAKATLAAQPKAPEKKVAIKASWKGIFKNKLSQADNAMLAFFYLNRELKQATVNSRQLNDILAQSKIKVTNVSSLLAQALKGRKISLVKKEGRTAYYHLTDQGENYAKDLLLRGGAL